MIAKRGTKVGISISITLDLLEKLEDYAISKGVNRSTAASTLIKFGWSYWDDKLRGA